MHDGSASLTMHLWYTAKAHIDWEQTHEKQTECIHSNADAAEVPLHSWLQDKAAAPNISLPPQNAAAAAATVTTA